MKFLIVGLGNPGAEYANTRHNIGFLVLDHLLRQAGHDPALAFKPDRYADLAELKTRGRVYLLAKPTTYMNLSGQAVQAQLQKHKLTPNQLLVLTDDLALPFGTLRLRPKGSPGGHNGLKDIEARLGHGNYPRLRLGIGNTFRPGQQVDYVLGDFGPDEEPHLPKVLDAAAKAVVDFGFRGLEQTMGKYNTSVLPPSDVNPPTEQRDA